MLKSEETNQTITASNKKRSGIESIFQALGWLQIVASPLLIGAIIGFVFYLVVKGNTGLFIGIAIACIGFFIGIIWATKVSGKKSTIDFMSRVNASPEIDKLENTKETNDPKP